jgi:hypothetical protein
LLLDGRKWKRKRVYLFPSYMPQTNPAMCFADELIKLVIESI